MLVAFYYATGGEDWKNNTNWLSAAPISEWYGVTTNPSGRYVTRLDLSDNGLWGEIPPELGNLAFLEMLNLPVNQLRGEIPPELGNLDNLEFLNLGGNDLRGEIPSELGNLAYLEYLVLGGNELEGEIPSELGNLASLEVLDLTDNKLRGRVPVELSNLKNLKTLKLERNRQLEGCLPEGSPVPFCASPKNVRFVWDEENGGVVFAWDPVEGATYYQVYDSWAGRGCPGGIFCDLLAWQVFETIYGPVETGNLTPSFYYVTACNSDGCSAIITEDGIAPEE